MKSLLLLPLLVALAHSACPSGFESFARPSGTWCMNVFPANNATSHYHSTVRCKGRFAELSGVESKSEMDALLILASQKNIAGSIWIGAQRTDACKGKKLSATCSQKTAFRWTDGVTTGTAGFSWLDKSQPDNAHGLKQDCIVAFFAPSNVVYKGVTWRPGAMDDVACTGLQLDRTGPRQVAGIVCGRKEE